MFDTRMEAIGMPAELDNTEVPYVHANSLTGQGNERAEYPQREVKEHRTVIYDDAWKPTKTEEWYAGLNEMVVDQEFDDENQAASMNHMVVDHDVYNDDEEWYWDA